jgi:hypothetical protein
MSFLCPRCRGWICNQRDALLHRQGCEVSMPSVSGWICNPPRRPISLASMSGFLCPRCRAGFATGSWRSLRQPCQQFLCPRCRAGFATVADLWDHQRHAVFLCPRCRAGFATRFHCVLRLLFHLVSMPSVSGWICNVTYRASSARASPFLCPRCRAGFATRLSPPVAARVVGFLCPRCRAGFATPDPDAGLGERAEVSMPSVSGWICNGSQDLGGLTWAKRQGRERSCRSRQLVYEC